MQKHKQEEDLYPGEDTETVKTYPNFPIKHLASHNTPK